MLVASPQTTPPSSPPRAPAEPFEGAVNDWLEHIKPGYGRFSVAFDTLGIEDTIDIAKVDGAIFEQLCAKLRDLCDAKSMHIKNIRRALVNAGCAIREQDTTPSPPRSRTPPPGGKKHAVRPASACAASSSSSGGRRSGVGGLAMNASRLDSPPPSSRGSGAGGRKASFERGSGRGGAAVRRVGIDELAAGLLTPTKSKPRSSSSSSGGATGKLDVSAAAAGSSSGAAGPSSSNGDGVAAAPASSTELRRSSLDELGCPVEADAAAEEGA